MADQYSQDDEPFDIFGSDPLGRNYIYGLSGSGDGQGLAPYGTRYAENLSQPTTAKRGGYFGNIGTINEPMTEFSSAFEVDGRTVQYPLIVPTLTVDELQLLRSTGQATPEIDQKAQQFALNRLSRGQDPFATTQELRYPQPQGLNPTPITGEIRETPRSFISGLFSDVLGGALNMPNLQMTGVPALDLFYANRKPLMNLMGVGDVQKTAERISYGEPLTSGAGGLGGTSRPLPETVGAALTVAPFVGEATAFGTRVGRAGARMVGERIAENVAMGRPNLPSMFAEPRSSLFAVEPSDLSYRGQHTAPNRDFGAPLHDLTGGGQMYPDDIYSSKAAQYYGGSVPYDQKAVSIAQQYRDKPDALVTIYRAVPKEKSNSEKLAELEKQMAAYMKRGTLPKDAKTSEGGKWYDMAYEEREKLRNLPDEASQDINDINAGDWVTLTREYAKDHGESALRGQYKIISKKVKAKEVYTNADSIHEFGYSPESVTKQTPTPVEASPTYSDPFANTIGSSIR